MQFPFLYLASASPRRRELLSQLGVEFELVSIFVDETPHQNESPATYVQRLARAKAVAGARQIDDPNALVLGADTSVVVDGQLLGKPNDAAHARAMLASLSNREHEVMSAIALAGRSDKQSLQISRVRFRAIEANERDAYVASGEPMDKAGAYAIQGRGAMFVSHLSGSYSGVMGLPLYELAQLLLDIDH